MSCRRFALLSLLLAAGDSGDAAAQAPPEVHVVAPGDTLWDIAASARGDPWYWPQIWSENPQLTSPHHIYPGNELTVAPTGRLSVRAAPFDPEAGELDAFDAPDAMHDGRELLRWALAERVPRVAFIEAGGRPDLGRVVASPEESVLLSDRQRVYLRLSEPRPLGARLAVYREVKTVRHPVSGARMGRVVELVAWARVVRLDRAVHTAVLDVAFAPVRRGDRVGGLGEARFRRRALRRAPRPVHGVVVATLEARQEMIGEQDVVFLDRGTTDGLQAGHLVRVLRSGDGLGPSRVPLPWRVVGELQVLDARPSTSAAVVLSSSAPLEVGDRVRAGPLASADSGGGFSSGGGAEARRR